MPANKPLTAPLLSIAIPTLNRKDLLQVTLDNLLRQLNITSYNIEIIVSDNASSDDTKSLFTDSGIYSNKVKYFNHEKRVDIDASFSRTVALCQGDFIVLFGDDDISLPGFISEVCECIQTHPDAGLIYVNRVIGDMELYHTTEVPHSQCPFGIQVMPIGKFIDKFTHWPGFVTCLVFSIKSWNKGIHTDRHDYPGYNFLNIIYRGSIGTIVCYVASPLVIQRRGIQSWKKHWPRYWLVSMPMLLDSLDKDGISNTALLHWEKHEITLRRFFIDCFVAKAYHYGIHDIFWKKSRQFQTLKSRKLLSLLIQFFVPSMLASLIYSISPKKG